MTTHSKRQFVISADMVDRGAKALAGLVAQIGCTCRWDDDGNPPDDCACATRMEQERWDLAYKVLNAAAEKP